MYPPSQHSQALNKHPTILDSQWSMAYNFTLLTEINKYLIILLFAYQKLSYNINTNN